MNQQRIKSLLAGTLAIVAIGAASRSATAPAGKKTVVWEYARCVQEESADHRHTSFFWREAGSGFLANDKASFFEKMGVTENREEVPIIDILQCVGSKGWRLAGVQVDNPGHGDVTYYFERQKE